MQLRAYSEMVIDASVIVYSMTGGRMARRAYWSTGVSGRGKARYPVILVTLRVVLVLMPVELKCAGCSVALAHSVRALLPMLPLLRDLCGTELALECKAWWCTATLSSATPRCRPPQCNRQSIKNHHRS